MSRSPFPELTSYGVLPHDIELTLDELACSPFVTGEGLRMYRWNADRRAELVDNLRIVVERLWEVGYEGEIGVDGSFAEAYLKPRDIDAYCVLSDAEALEHHLRLERLNALEGERVWAFGEEDQLRLRGINHPVSPLWAKYNVDLHFDQGQFSGVFGPHRERLTIRKAFRMQRETFQPKGVVRIVRAERSRGRRTRRRR